MEQIGIEKIIQKMLSNYFRSHDSNEGIIEKKNVAQIGIQKIIQKILSNFFGSHEWSLTSFITRLALKWLSMLKA